MSKIVNTRLPKLCHARPGDFFRICHPVTGELIEDEIFVLTVLDKDDNPLLAADGREAKRSRPTNKPVKKAKPHDGEYPSAAGIYHEARKLVLVSLKTGTARELPHLSERMERADTTLEALALSGMFPVLAPSGTAVPPALIPEDWTVTVNIEDANADLYPEGIGMHGSHVVDLREPTETLHFLRRLVSDRLMSVTKVSTEAEDRAEREHLADWRKAVALGQTFLSFKEYSDAETAKVALPS